MPRLLTASDDDVAVAGGVLAAGGVVAIPTETVYGLAANALDANAVARIFEAKQRPFFDPLIVHVADVASLSVVVDGVNDQAHRLMDAFWPGPLTLVLPKAAAIPGLVTSGLETVGVRMPSHPVARRIIECAGVPLAAPSANPFGRLSPTTAQHVIDGLGDAVDAVVDGGPSEWGVESTIVDASVDGVVRVLRFGAISVEEVQSAVGNRATVEVAVITTNQPNTPGQLESHYAPSVPLVCVDSADAIAGGDDIGVIGFGGNVGHIRSAITLDLSPEGELRDAAAALFRALHEVDAAGVARVYAVAVPDVGIGRAINDRLRRAAAKR